MHKQELDLEILALVGRLSVLECAFWGFLLLFALLYLFPLLRLFVTSCALAWRCGTVFRHYYQRIAKIAETFVMVLLCLSSECA